MNILRRYALAAVMFFLWLISCSLHFESPPPSPEAEAPAATAVEPLPLSPREELLCLPLWGASEELSFQQDRTGNLNGLPFAWRLEGEKLSLSFFPGCSVGGELNLRYVHPGSRAEIKNDEYRFCVSSLLSFSNMEKRTEARREAELAAQKAAGESIAQMALSFVGYNYKYGGKSPETGFDCSGLVYYIYGQHGYSLQRVADEQAKQGRHLEPDEIMPGDLLAFFTSGKYVGHVGIYVGYGYYVHAMGAAYGVQLTALDDPYLPRVYEGRRLIGCEELYTVPAA